MKAKQQLMSPACRSTRTFSGDVLNFFVSDEPEVMEERLSDGSIAYNVDWTDNNDKRVSIRCFDMPSANRLCAVLKSEAHSVEVHE
jgi:hypothetical protein